MNNKFYITTAIPYVNSAPHVGFALEIVQADVVARYHRLGGSDVYFLTGTDENALKNVQAAENAGAGVEEFVEGNAKKFAELKEALGLSYDQFIRTSEQRHFLGAQKLWTDSKKKDIEKRKYKGLYCVGCEAFYTPDELNDEGECIEHPGRKLDEVEEENYFFKLSNYEGWLREIIEKGELKIIPEIRKNEVLGLIKQGLRDFSISRSVARAHGWGVPVPDDPDQICYVWYDALANYITALGYGSDNLGLYKKYWEGNERRNHVIGKGIVRFHALYWPAMLKSAGLPIPNTIFVHGYVTSGGQKISKSVGNVIDPFVQVEKYGQDAFRYYLLREIPAYGDGDYTEERFKEVYNADLANGLGNLVARVARMAQDKGLVLEQAVQDRANRIQAEIDPMIEEFRLNDALEFIWGAIKSLDQYIERERPWQLSNSEANKRLGEVIVGSEAVTSIREIAASLLPFLPDTAGKILKQFGGGRVEIAPSLFPRIA